MKPGNATKVINVTKATTVGNEKKRTAVIDKAKYI
jgi:hypothetical protein